MAVVVAALFTVCDTAVLVLPPKLVSPAYVAVIEWIPTDKAEVVHVATALGLRDTALQTGEAPSRNVTGPVGVPGLPDVTVAVNVTPCPKTLGFALLPSAVLLAAAATTIPPLVPVTVAVTVSVAVTVRVPVVFNVTPFVKV
jgi:hypothetical protein